MKNPSSAKLFQALVQKKLVGKDLKAPRSPVQIMQELTENKKTANFTITVKDQRKIKVNRLVLRARSGLFRKLFHSVRNDPTNQVNDFSGLSYDALYEVMHFLHTGRLSAYFDEDPKSLNEKEIQDRIDVLEELNNRDAPEYYKVTFTENFYDELDRAMDRMRRI